jgi:hypothetical protein
MCPRARVQRCASAARSSCTGPETSARPSESFACTCTRRKGNFLDAAVFISPRRSSRAIPHVMTRPRDLLCLVPRIMWRILQTARRLTIQRHGTMKGEVVLKEGDTIINLRVGGGAALPKRPPPPSVPSALPSAAPATSEAGGFTALLERPPPLSTDPASPSAVIDSCAADGFTNIYLGEVDEGEADVGSRHHGNSSLSTAGGTNNELDWTRGSDVFDPDAREVAGPGPARPPPPQPRRPPPPTSASSDDAVPLETFRVPPSTPPARPAAVAGAAEGAAVATM